MELAVTVRRTLADEYERAFGATVFSLREVRGLSQEELGLRAGVSADTIRRLEHGRFSPSLRTTRKICHGLDMHPSTLLAAVDVGDAEPSPGRQIADLVDALEPEQAAIVLRVAGALAEEMRGLLESAGDGGA